MYQKLNHLGYVEGHTVNELIFDSMKMMKEFGQHVPSRNGGATSLYNLELTLEDPLERHLNLQGRTSNIFQLIAESFWVLSASGKVTEFLEFFLPRALDYSDDGETWRGAYGPRLYEYDQLQGVIQRFKKEGKGCRRAVVDIYQSEKDSPQSLREEYNLMDSKDVPCNDFIFFWIEPDDTFHMKTVQRSGDAIFGAGSINMFEFSFIHEHMYQQVKTLFPELKLGAYHHNTINYHLYDFTAAQADAVVENSGLQRFEPSREGTIRECIFPNGVHETCQFFQSLVGAYTKVITNATDPWKLPETVDMIFTRYSVPKTDNLLYTYAHLIAIYILSRLKDDNTENGTYKYQFQDNVSETLCEAVVDSKFRKFEIE